eukprot:888489-Prorocentrum_lima.AAC.1
MHDRFVSRLLPDGVLVQVLHIDRHVQLHSGRALLPVPRDVSSLSAMYVGASTTPAGERWLSFPATHEDVACSRPVSRLPR